MAEDLDVVIVGSGPNGLAAAVTLARAGLSVRVIEGGATLGGGLRTEPLAEGFRYDVCAAVHPLAFASRFFRDFGLPQRVRFVVPPVSYAHPLEGGRAAVAYRDLERTADELDGRGGAAWRKLFEPLVSRSAQVSALMGAPVPHGLRHPATAARLGFAALQQGGPWWDLGLPGEAASALLTGVCAHSSLRLPSLAGAAVGLALAVQGHVGGWPIPIGGSQAIADALAADLHVYGGRVTTGFEVGDLRDLPRSRVVLFNTSPAAAVRIAGGRLPPAYVRAVARIRSVAGVAKADFALAGPVPWLNPGLGETATVHLGGSRSAIARAEQTVISGKHSADPYVLVAQPSLFDDSRAPAGSHVLWAYTHVPLGSTVDQLPVITRQIERYAPGFSDLIITARSRTAAELGRYSPNYPGGDISGGAVSVRQLVARPTLSWEPWRMPAAGLYVASGGTSPGPGVHGMAGYHAALSILRREFGIRSPPVLTPPD